MPSCCVPGLVRVKSAKTILVPSGDQPGANARDIPLVVSGIFARPVPSGWTTYSEPLPSNKIERPLGDQLPKPSRAGRPLGELTEREREALALVAEGLSNRAIATRLFVTERTVEAHVKQILLKLGLNTDPGSHRCVLAVLAYLRSMT